MPLKPIHSELTGRSPVSSELVLKSLQYQIVPLKLIYAMYFETLSRNWLCIYDYYF